MTNTLRRITRHLLILKLTVLSSLALADGIPEDLSIILDRFLKLEETSVEIRQEIHWRYFGGVDSLRAFMDIRDEQSFRLNVPGFGLDVYRQNDSLITINHRKKQVLIEKARHDAMIDQLFIGGDISSVKLRRSKDLGNNRKRYEFVFRDEYSEWQRMKIWTWQELPQEIELLDYDENTYRIMLRYSSDFVEFNLTRLLNENPMGFEIADLRKK